MPPCICIIGKKKGGGGRQRGKVVCCNVLFCAHNLLSDLEEYVFIKLNVKRNNFIFVLIDIKVY